MAVDGIQGKSVERVIAESASKSKDRKVGEMGKDQFLELLITQLKNQDPLNPEDDKEFIGQMAQFSSLEQMQNMNKSMTSMMGANFIGKQIKSDFIDESTHNPVSVDGVVSAINVVENKVFAMVNGKQVPIEKITNITDVSLKTALDGQDISKYTGYMGFNVKGTITNPDKNQIRVIGNVGEISKSETGPVATLNNVKLDVVSFKANKKFANFIEQADYLNSQKGKEITVTVDAGSGKYTQMKGILKDFTIDQLGIKDVTLDGMNVPVESITSVMSV